MTTSRTPWHVDDEALAGYAAGKTSPVLSTSVETHLLACPTCRERLAAETPRIELDAAWDRLADVVDRPSPGPLGRVGPLRRFGVLERLVRSTVATPTMVLAALAAVALVVVVPLVAAAVTGGAGVVALLVAAPLAPVGAVALAYRDEADPAGETGLATPSAGLRLVALRSVLVSAAALVAASVALLLLRLWVDLSAAMVLSWCLPGLAFATLVLLAGTTRLDPARVAGVLALGWTAAVVVGSTVGRHLRPEAVLDVIASPALQATALAVALAALFLTVARRDTVSYRRTA